MCKNTIKNYNAPSCTGFNETKIHSEESHTNKKISPLKWRLRSVIKNEEQLSRKSRRSGFRNPGYRIRNASTGQLPGSGSGTGDIELNEVISTGKALYLEAQALHLTQRDNPQQALPLSIKTKTGLAMGAALILSGTGTFLQQFNPRGRSGPLHGNNLNNESVFSVPGTTVGPADRLPSHTRPNEGAVHAHKHARRHLAAPQPLTTVLPLPEVSKKKLFDLSCVEERVKLSFSEVLRNIADTLNSPMKKTGEEWQIIYDYKILKSGCPKTSDKIYLLNIMNYIDVVANRIASLFPDLVPLMILQNIIPPVLKSIADSMDGKKMDANLIIEINNQLLTLPLLFASSLDLHGRNMLSTEKKVVVKNIIPEKIKIHDGHAYISFGGGEFKIMRDSDGVYIYDIDHKSLQLSKKHMIYKRSNRKWVTDKIEQITLSEAESVESRLGRKIDLAAFARKESTKSYKNRSSPHFITEILAKSGLIKREKLDLLRSKLSQSELHPEYFKEITKITNENQLLKVKEGQIVIFTNTKDSTKNIEHMMLSTGNGLFAGANNERISSEFGNGDNIITAEQLGAFENKVFTSNRGEKLSIYSGFLAESEANFYENYKDAAIKLEDFHYKEDSVYAIALVLSRTGDISSEFVSALHDSLTKKTPISKYIKNDKEWLDNIELAEKVHVGGMIFLTNNAGEDYGKGTFALRLNDEEFFIPKLFEPTIKSGGTSTIYKIDSLKENIIERELFVKRAEFNVSGTRTQALLGKDARFYAVDNILYVRAHGLPMSINYMSPLEVVNIIKGLSIIKNIDLKKIGTIVIESCFGATGFPSIGKSISAITGKRVIAYRGKYRPGNRSDELKKVVYTPTSLSNLEIIASDIAERNMKFLRKIMGIYSYFKNTKKEPLQFSSSRSKRDDPYFNLLLMDISRFILGRKTIRDFIKDNPTLFWEKNNHLELIYKKIQRDKSIRSHDFFELCMEVIYSSQEASRYLDLYISKTPKKKHNKDIVILPDRHEPDGNLESVKLIVNGISAELNEISDAMGISKENKYLSPKKWDEFGFSGEIFWDDKKNRFFKLKKEGVPSNHYWHYTDDALDDDNWQYAGRHAGTLEQPKDWYEYGEAGCIYYEEKYGYLILKKDGRPSDHYWYFPHKGGSNLFWKFITWKAGTFKTPLAWNDNGIAGNIYYSVESESFYILRKTGNPSFLGWRFPPVGTEDKNWIYAGRNDGTFDFPKKWNEYGQAGSIYYEPEFGYLMLKDNGNPSVNDWYFPSKGQSDNYWNFISFEAGTYTSAKLRNVEGMAGEVYYSVKNKSYYILRKDGKPSRHDWNFPAAGMSDNNWLYAGKNQGTLNSPKKWTEYGKVGSIYHDENHGYLSLKKEGRPSDHNWFFPRDGETSLHWNFISYAGSFESPKLQGDKGEAGEVYYSSENLSFYILRKKDAIARQGWNFPFVAMDDNNWIYAGQSTGTLDSPKSWNEYGKVGSLYYEKNYGYFILKTEGRPSDKKWLYPKNGESNDNWKFISLEAGTFNRPKQYVAEGIAGEVYYSSEYNSFYILRKTGNPSHHGWHFPTDDNQNWIYAGPGRGTIESPKTWYEYGKAGMIYYEAEYGYMTLKTDGRPSDNNWIYPKNFESNEFWNFISFKKGSFTTPKSLKDNGATGEIYYYDDKKLFYMLRNTGNPSINGWPFPDGKNDNVNWFYAGKNKGTVDSPKIWSEYGKTGSVYYQSEYGYFTLKNEGSPSANNWYFPQNAKSDEHWKFISYKAGSFNLPKRQNVEGVAGEVYFSDEGQSFYILKNAGNPSSYGWQFPLDNKDDENWLFAGYHKGTLDDPKVWNEYGKIGSVYYEKQHGFLTLKKEGRPSDNDWYFPGIGMSNDNWEFITFIAGSFEQPKRQNDKGLAGEVYYCDVQKDFYILQKPGTPLISGWPFPSGKKNNLHWIYAGKNKGSLDSPKTWSEYGKVGQIYYKAEYGYLILKTEGNPSENKWYYPNIGEPNDHWIYIKR